MNKLTERCLTFGIRLYPFEQKRIFDRYEKFKLPDNILSNFKKEEIENYTQALYLSAGECSRDWSKGFDMLKEIGFIEKSRIDGHRKYITLVWSDKNN